MAHVVFDRVRDTTATTGFNHFALSGSPPAGFRTFGAVCAVGDTFAYCAAVPGGADWEVGVGTYSAANTVNRTQVLASSNFGSVVSFPAGNKEIFLTHAATAPQRVPSTEPSGSTTTGALTVAGGVGIGGALNLHSYLQLGGQVAIGVAQGTAPLVLGSTTRSTNLNADLLDDQHGAHYLDLASHTGNLAPARLNGGANASSATFWRGDGSWSAPPAEADTLATVAARGAATPTALQVTSGAASTSTTTGALTVTGGVGVGGTVTSPRFSVDANGYLTLVSGNPALNFDATDYLQYDRAGNAAQFIVGGANRFQVSAVSAYAQVPLILSHDPTSVWGAATKQYADAAPNTKVRVVSGNWGSTLFDPLGTETAFFEVAVPAGTRFVSGTLFSGCVANANGGSTVTLRVRLMNGSSVSQTNRDFAMRVLSSNYMHAAGAFSFDCGSAVSGWFLRFTASRDGGGANQITEYGASAVCVLP